MRRLVALLRGINVGGRNTVPMADLRALSGALGLGRARTVLASGNLAFDSGESVPDLRRLLEDALSREFGYSALVLVLEQEALAHVSRAFPWPSDETLHDYVLFFDDVAVRDQAAQEARAMDATASVPGGGAEPSLPCLFWRAPVGRTLSADLGTLFARPRFAAHSTQRNLRTVEKVAGL